MLDSRTMKRRYIPATSASADPLHGGPGPGRRGSWGSWPLFILCLLVTTLGLAGCGGSTESKSQVQREEFEIFLADYLPRLGRAYAERNPSLLEDYAVAKELAKIEARTTELSAAGRVYVPELVQLTVEDFTIWNHSNAFVSTFEVWNIRSYTLGTEILLQESLGQKNRVKYQLKRKDDGWVVLYRELGETIES